MVGLSAECKAIRAGATQGPTLHGGGGKDNSFRDLDAVCLGGVSRRVKPCPPPQPMIRSSPDAQQRLTCLYVAYLCFCTPLESTCTLFALIVAPLVAISLDEIANTVSVVAKS